MQQPPIGRALEDSPPKVYPRPGDAGTRTVELFGTDFKVIGRAAIEVGEEPGVLVVGERTFVFQWRNGGFYIEKPAKRVQMHL